MDILFFYFFEASFPSCITLNSNVGICTDAKRATRQGLNAKKTMKKNSQESTEGNVCSLLDCIHVFWFIFFKLTGMATSSVLYRKYAYLEQKACTSRKM